MHVAPRKVFPRDAKRVDLFLNFVLLNLFNSTNNRHLFLFAATVTRLLVAVVVDEHVLNSNTVIG